MTFAALSLRRTHDGKRQVAIVEAEGEWRYFAIYIVGPCRWGYLHLYYDGPHHQFSLGWLHFCWRLR